MEEVRNAEGQNPLAAAPIIGLLLKFAVPSVLSMLVDALYNAADQIFIGQGVGYLGIAAATVTFPFVTIILSAATLLGIGGSVYTSMSMGAGKNEEAEKTLGAVFALSAAAGILFTVVCLIFLRPLALAFGATEGAQGSLPYVLDYASIILLGAPFSMAAIALSSIARAEGSPAVAMGCFLAGAILNLILDPVYIFVLGWGVRGAAIATVTAQILSAVILLVYFLKKGRIRLKGKNLCPAPSGCGQVVMLGLPACMIQGAAAILQIELNKTVVRFGTAAVSGEAALGTIGVVLKISSVVVSVSVGIGVGVQPILGFNRSAGLERRVKETVQKSVCAATVVSVVGWLGCAVFPAEILGLFGMHDPAYLEFGIRCMRIFLLAWLWRLPGRNLPVLSGDRQAVKAMALSILRPLLLMVPLIHVFSSIWGWTAFYTRAPQQTI
jgi:putative MATE family efflux protein